MVEWILNLEPTTIIFVIWAFFSSVLSFSIIKDLTQCHNNIKSLKGDSE